MLWLLPSLIAGLSVLSHSGGTPPRCLAGSGGPGAQSPPAAQPIAIAQNKIYVADEVRGTVSVIDAADNRTIKAIPLAFAHGNMSMVFAPHNVQASPDGQTVWVTAPPPMLWSGCGDGDSLPPPPMPPGMGEEVVAIDPVADTILARIELFPQGADTMLHLAHVVFDRDSRYAYVSANLADQVIRIDARTREEVGRYALGKSRGPHGMRFCGDKLVVANMTGKSLSVIDPVAGSVTETPVGGIAVQIACTGDGRSAFATLYDTREVVRYDLAGGAVTRIPLPAEAKGPVQLYLAPGDRKLYVADQGVLFGQPAHNILYEIDVASSQVTSGVRVGRAPHGVVVSSDGAFAYVTNVWDATVSVVDLKTLKEVATVGVGDNPNGITYWSAPKASTSALRD
jgi:YVTN family beta-propeller protein